MKRILELTHEEVSLLVQGCGLGLQQPGLLPEERIKLRELVQKIARESSDEKPETEQPD